jgi:von Willebrand factor type A domain
VKSRANVVFNLNNFTTLADIQAAVSQIPFLDQNTNTSGGLWVAKSIMFTEKNGDRPKAPNTAIVITDGVSTYDHEKTIPYAQEMKNSGIVMIAIGVGVLVSKDELEGIASIGKDGKPIVYQVGGYELLSLVQERLASVDCEMVDGKYAKYNFSAYVCYFDFFLIYTKFLMA